jgi:hypothetical protein
VFQASWGRLDMKPNRNDLVIILNDNFFIGLKILTFSVATRYVYFMS